MVISSVRLDDKDEKLLNKYMEENHIKKRSDAIRECIRYCVDKNDLKDIINDINTKTNKLIRNQFLIKKLLEQDFVNGVYGKNKDVESDECLKDFYERYHSYKDNFLG